MNFNSAYPKIFTVLFILTNPGFLEQIPNQIDFGKLFTSKIDVTITSTITHAIVFFVSSLVIIGGSGIEVNLVQHFAITTMMFFFMTPGVLNLLNIFNDEPVFMSKKTTLLNIIIQGILFYGILFLVYSGMRMPWSKNLSNRNKNSNGNKNKGPGTDLSNILGQINTVKSGS